MFSVCIRTWNLTITQTFWFLYYYRVSAADFDYLKVIGTGSFGKVQDLKDLKSHIAWYLLYTVFLELVWTQIIGLYSGVLGQTQGERYTLCSQSPTEKHYLIKERGMDTFFAFSNLFRCSCKLIIVIFTGKTSHVWTQSVVKDSQPSIPGEAPLQFSDQGQTVPRAGLCMWRRGMLTYTHHGFI